jgi:hypothetical protein
MEGSPHCYAHDSRFRNARREAAAKGGRLGGRGRASISKEIKGIRELTGLVIELKAQDRLPNHIACHMKDFISLLKLYSTLVSQEVRTSKTEELEPTHAHSAPQLIDAKALRKELEAVVHRVKDEQVDTLSFEGIVGHGVPEGGERSCK